MDDRPVLAALRCGAAGYVLKASPRHTLVAAVRAVVNGGVLLDERVARRLSEDANRRASSLHQPDKALTGLTAQGIEILREVASGFTNTEIASDCTSPKPP